MSAAEALRAARAAGLDLRIDGQDLVLHALAPPSPAVLDLLARHKADVIAILGAGKEAWTADDWRALYDERAAIAEFDGDLPRPEAEAHAFECCVVEWLDRKVEHPPTGRCLACEGGDGVNNPLLPFGTVSQGHAQLHAHCWGNRHEARKEEAAAALVAIGIKNATELPDDSEKCGRE